MKNKVLNLSKGPVGEPFVWFTGMGLALGVLMITFLIGLILVKGLEVFWPREAVVLQLEAASDAQIMGSPYVGGVVVKKQKKVVRDLDVEGETNMEWQLFVGNKDIYGFSFIYLDERDIATIQKPENYIRIERLEYGDAFGMPVRLRLSEGDKNVVVTADEKNFYEILDSTISETHQRWDEINKIEEGKIGKINRELQDLKIKEKVLTRDQPEGYGAKLATVQSKIKQAQAEFQLLAAEARKLRELQTLDTFTYQLVTGQEKTLQVSNIVHYYLPNQLSYADKVQLFAQKAWAFLVEEPREANTEGGVFPAIFGTCVMTILMSAAVVPFGVIAAIYLREYAKQGFFVRMVRIAVNNLAGVPSIVFGVFGLGFFVYFVGSSIDHIFFKEYLPTPTFGTGGILWASLTLALLTVPVVIVATEEAIAAVPRGIREGSLACGASKWQTIKNVVLPASAPGILTGLILAMARGASEVAPLMLIGVVKLAPSLPIDGIAPFFHFERKFMHLGFHIYDLGFQSPDSEAAKPMVFATTLLLILLVLTLNLGAIFIRERLRKKFATGTF